jgi:hypothetical protein
MSKVTLYLTFGLLGIVALFTGSCADQSAPVPTTEGKITVTQSGGAGMLIAECGDRSYISSIADYILEGTVVRVESKWNEGKTSIYTYTDLSIDAYVKGVPFKENTLQIVTPGGTVGGISQWVEDQPIFHEGKKVRIYLQKNNGALSIVCAQFGVEEIQ